MTVVHIAYKYGENNTGGAAIASTRLHKAMLRTGVNSHYICVYREETEGTNVYELPNGFKRKLFLFLTKVFRCIWRFTKFRKSIFMNVVPLWGLEKLLRSIKPDVVHVHWLNADVASFEQIAKLPYPIVFNLHDLFVINAIEAHPFSDARIQLGYTKENSNFIERWLFNRKKKMFSFLKKFSFIGPSEWACKVCQLSSLGNKHNAASISNLVNSAFMEPADIVKDCKNKFFTIVFGAYGGRGNNYKGFSDFSSALKLLSKKEKENSRLLIYGENGESCLIEGIETEFLGVIHSPSQMIGVMRNADVFAFPSRAETQGMTKVEALLCGVPVVAFNRTACAEGIFHVRNGWIAEDGDISSFADGIRYFYNKWESNELDKIKYQIQASAKSCYSERGIVEKIIHEYEDLTKE